ncbi:MAG: glycosyltransferase [Candidatus Aenigmarchaeota archaeon]|nr:glycosyltransferase [Candidatus Aenigmarchaeota archaeon]
MKVFVVGPVPPYRGGISHSNATLCRNLARRHDVTCISFSRQFPRFLYPGRKQTDPNAQPLGVRTRFVLDSINPLTWLRVSRLARKERPQHLVFQWWSPFFLPAYATVALLAGKTKRIAVCQNVAVHESGVEGWLARLMTRTFFRQMDRLVTLSTADEREARALCPAARITTIIEGTYAGQVGAPLPKARARANLRLAGKVLLFFGFVRQYKGLIHLIRALPLVLAQMPVKILIVGEFWEGREDILAEIKLLGLNRSVEIIDRYVTDEEAVRYFSAVDAVVLPYTSSTESGIIQLAYGLNTPVITTAVGGNADLIEDGKTGLLVPPGDPEALAGAILEFYRKKLEGPIRANMRRRKELFVWTTEKERAFFGP